MDSVYWKVLWYKRRLEHKPVGDHDEDEKERGTVWFGFPTLVGKPLPRLLTFEMLLSEPLTENLIGQKEGIYLQFIGYCF